jgi:hypothetical protein
MHIHPSQINANAQTDALHAADKAAAKREVERTRKKLLEFASEIAGEAAFGEDCIVQLGSREEAPREEASREEGQRPQKRQLDNQNKNNNNEETNSDDNTSISDWA